MSEFAIKGLERLIGRIPQHSAPLPPESSSPILHYRLGANDAWNLLKYFERKTKHAGGYERPLELHTRNLRNMVLLALVEAFERYLKETAALCVDHLAPLTLDDRLGGFGKVDPARIAALFEERSTGRAVCESDTWSSTEDIAGRFNRLLNDLDAPNVAYQLLPKPKEPQHWRKLALDVLFQLRHTIAHNLGVITHADSLKLRRLTRQVVEAGKVLALTNGDVWYAKVFLDETVAWLNFRISERLCVLLTDIHARDPEALDPPSVARKVASQFQGAAKVANAEYVHLI